jgi:hypothetical protein
LLNQFSIDPVALQGSRVFFSGTESVSDLRGGLQIHCSPVFDRHVLRSHESASARGQGLYSAALPVLRIGAADRGQMANELRGKLRDFSLHSGTLAPFRSTIAGRRRNLLSAESPIIQSIFDGGA